MDLTTQTPAEIDTVLAEAQTRLYAAQYRLDEAQEALSRALKSKAAAPSALYIDSAIERHQQRIAMLQFAIQNETAKIKPLNAEFDRRGGWTRAFKVTNAGGHIHRTMACTTCFVTTRFAWLPQVSGLDETQIVDMAASAACTICYPTAPVDKPTVLFTKDEVAAQQEREAKAAAKVAREAKKAAAAIGPIKATPYETLRTITAARTWLTDAHMWELNHPSYRPDMIAEVAEAVAAKEGKTVETVMAEAAKRAAKRR